MKRLLKIALILFGIGLIAGIGTYMYVFHKPHRNVAKEKPAFVVSAEQLLAEFSENETESYNRYGDQVLQISGQVVDKSENENLASIVLVNELEGINCSFDAETLALSLPEIEKIQVGDEVTVKGKCDGYDMIMGVVLTRCVLLSDRSN